MVSLQKLCDKLDININTSKNIEEYDYQSSIISCFNNCTINQNQEKMYIMADFG